MFKFLTGARRHGEPDTAIGPLIDGFSIEVLPRTAARIDAFGDILPKGTRVYIAHIDGTPLDDMVATARRLAEAGMNAMPHFPARMITGEAALADWIARYQGEAGVSEALLLAGGVPERPDSFRSSMDMMATGLFDRHGFTRLHVAGHPEGNPDIDKDGTTRIVDEALRWKQGFAERTDAAVAIVTQFVFDADPLLGWIARLRAAGITLPVHVGIAGPAKLQTLIRYAATCGVGPSLRVLQRRLSDVGRLLVPYEPSDLLATIARAEASAGHRLVEQIHLFPFGGIEATASWARDRSAGAAIRPPSASRPGEMGSSDARSPACGG